MGTHSTREASERLRGLARVALTLVLSTAFALLAAEGLVRWLAPQPVWIQPEDLYVADPPGRYRLRGGVDGTMTDRTEYAVRIVTDETGVRVPARDAPRRPGDLRILALGDSFTFGVGVEQHETWIARVGAALRAEGLPVETIDGGVPGYGPPDEAGLFERHLAAFDPDLVVVGVYLANDLLDASPASLSVEVRDGALVVGGHEPGLRDWLNYHSHLFLLAKNALPPSLQRPLRQALGLGPTPTERQIGTEMGAYARVLPEGARAGLAACDAAYGRLVAATRDRGIPLVAVILPEHIAVDPSAWRARLDYLGFDPGDYDRDGPRNIFRRLLEQRGIPYLDLTEAIEEGEADGTHLYYAVDTHFTPEGHALAAREIEPFLRAQLRRDGPEGPPPKSGGRVDTAGTAGAPPSRPDSLPSPRPV